MNSAVCGTGDKNSAHGANGAYYITRKECGDAKQNIRLLVRADLTPPL